MKIGLRKAFTGLMGFFAGILLISGCKGDPEIPVLTTSAVSGISYTVATTGGSITSDGGAEITARGVCWGTSHNPQVTGQHTSDSKGGGSFTSTVTGLNPNTLYYIRAYATNEAGTAYGNEVSFTTMAVATPAVTTSDVSGITNSSATAGGNVVSDGGSAVTGKGICWGTQVNPATSGNKTENGAGTGTFTASLTGLLPGTTYHVRAYAINSEGTSYGSDISFTTAAVTATLTTAAASGITRTTAVSGGNISSSGGAAITVRGVCWGTSSGPTTSGPHTADGTGSGPFTSSITGLTPNTFYYVRAYATNSAGTAYGNEVTFTSSPVGMPELTTSVPTSVTLGSALSGGAITTDNGGPVTAKGVCWNTTGNPSVSDLRTTDGTGSASFTSSITGLNAGTVYYLRAYATNSAGTGYGNQVILSTSVADIDGNVYRTVLIGNQLWMQSDLKTSRLNNNNPIPNVDQNSEWIALTTPAWCWYNNEAAMGNTFGMLYNWYAAHDSRLCPTGWHVPSDDEYLELEVYLGMTTAVAEGTLWRGTDEGLKLKSTATWGGDLENTNSSGFTALGGGFRFGVTGEFFNIGQVSYWWCSTEHWTDTTKGLYRRLDYDRTNVFREGVTKAGGKFVRCLKN